MSVHIIGAIGLIVVFVIGTIRPINLGALALVMTYAIGTIWVGESPSEIYKGFPVDLLMLLVGVTYLFSVASANGTVEFLVAGSTRLVKNRRALIPVIVFITASLPAMAGALGSAGVAMLAPLSARLAERYDIDRRMIGLMVVHGASAGNFSPLNVLSAIVVKAVNAGGLELSVMTLFLGNLAFNVVLAGIIYVVFGGLRLSGRNATPQTVVAEQLEVPLRRLSRDQTCTLVALVAVAVLAFGFGLNIGFLALAAGVFIQLIFPVSGGTAETRIPWGVVLLVCGIVTYVAALQRYGTVQALGNSIASLTSPMMIALLLCFIGAITSAFASSAGILGALVPLAVPFMQRGEIGTTGLVVALAISATVVDSTPFSTVGALVVANAADNERSKIYNGLLLWGGTMVITAPLLTWLIFVVLFRG